MPVALSKLSANGGLSALGNAMARSMSRMSGIGEQLPADGEGEDDGSDHQLAIPDHESVSDRDRSEESSKLLNRRCLSRCLFRPLFFRHANVDEQHQTREEGDEVVEEAAVEGDA